VADEEDPRPHAIVVSPNPPDSPGGVERSAGLVGGVLKRLGWRVTIVWPHRDPPRAPYVLGLGPLWSSRAGAARAHAAGPAELVVTNGFLGAGFPSDVPRIHIYHGTLVDDTLALRPMPTRELVRRIAGGGLAERLSGRDALVVSVSNAAAEEVRRFYRVRTDIVLPNPVDTDIFRPFDRATARHELGLPQDARLALFVGRPDQRKGAHLVPEAAARANYELMVAGSGQLDGARYLGVLAPPQLALAYNAADCVLLPSAYEGCSFVVLEALACGTPLITTRVGWVKDLVRAHPDYDALCVRPEVSEIADRLTRLRELAGPELISAVQRSIATDHSLDAYTAQWVTLLDRVGLGGAGRPTAAGSA
jgi:glycosyltransferase involved in cell wall biosynthesis